MAGIKPFRYLIVYPALSPEAERAWRERARLVDAEIKGRR